MTVMSFFCPAPLRYICGGLISVLLSLLFCSVRVYAGDVTVRSLPNPLTLEYALRFADQPHPDLSEARAALEKAGAVRLGAESKSGVNVSILGRLRWIEPSPLVHDQSHNDSSVSLNISKRLYDFGRSKARLSAAESDIRAEGILYMDVRRRRRIDIMARFFDVLLADMEYARDSEATAVAYARFNRLTDRNKLGGASDLAVLKAETGYRKARRKRAVSEARQRITRSLLSETLNRPGILPARLAKPALPENDRKLPAMGTLVREALDRNPVLLAMRVRVDAGQERLKAARAEKTPVLTAEIEGARYERQFGSRDRWRAGLTMEIPLFTGGRVDSAIASAEAELHLLEARLARKKMEIRQAILETWEKINVLIIQRDEVRTLRDYRDLYLDRSRTLYGQGVKADLGDAMVKYSGSLLRRAETEFELALAWARLDSLAGRPVFVSKSNSPVNNIKPDR